MIKLQRYVYQMCVQSENCQRWWKCFFVVIFLQNTKMCAIPDLLTRSWHVKCFKAVSLSWSSLSWDELTLIRRYLLTDSFHVFLETDLIANSWCEKVIFRERRCCNYTPATLAKLLLPLAPLTLLHFDVTTGKKIQCLELYLYLRLYLNNVI